MKTDIKHGLIITYFKISQEAENMLKKTIETLSKENYYLILASHSPVDATISKLCDFYFYQDLNIVDNTKYSHGVAENNLIEIALLHLKYKNIDWTYKLSYDVEINDVTQLYDWKQNYNYNFVSCQWGNNFICTNSFFANVNFILDNVDFYKNINDMYLINNTLENCWQKNIEDKKLQNHVYTYPNKEVFFGENKIDKLFYNYNEIEFTYDENEYKFYISNNGPDYCAEIRIFDYYTDLCIYLNKSFDHPSGTVMWVIPPNNVLLEKAKNGFYLEIYLDDITIVKNINITNFENKDQLHKKFKTIKNHEVKYNEYCDFNDFYFYSDFGIDIENIKTFVDIGACYGFASLPFLKNNIKTYLIDADITNIELLKNNYSNNKNIEIVYNAICSHDGSIKFYLEEGISVVSSIFETNALGNKENRISVDVPAITPNTLIEKIIKEDIIDLMKIDIEGAEYILFDSITNENLQKINKLIIEFHNNDNREILQILEKLTENDFFFKIKSYREDQENDFHIDVQMGIIYAYK